MTIHDPLVVVAERIVESLKKKLPHAPKLDDIRIDTDKGVVVFVGKNGVEVEMQLEKLIRIHSISP